MNWTAKQKALKELEQERQDKLRDEEVKEMFKELGIIDLMKGGQL